MSTTYAEHLHQLTNSLKPGGRYTLFHIDSMMAMTHKFEITVKDVRPDGFAFVARGKRTTLFKRWESQSYQSAPLQPLDWAIFEGWDQPITCDTDQRSGIMRGNACYNFIGTPEQVRAWIETGQRNPFFKPDHVLSIQGDTETVVFPEMVTPGNHAVIDRIMNA